MVRLTASANSLIFFGCAVGVVLGQVVLEMGGSYEGKTVGVSQLTNRSARKGISGETIRTYAATPSSALLGE